MSTYIKVFFFIKLLDLYDKRENGKKSAMLIFLSNNFKLKKY